MEIIQIELKGKRVVYKSQMKYIIHNGGFQPTINSSMFSFQHLL